MRGLRNAIPLPSRPPQVSSATSSPLKGGIGLQAHVSTCSSFLFPTCWIKLTVPVVRLLARPRCASRGSRVSLATTLGIQGSCWAAAAAWRRCGRRRRRGSRRGGRGARVRVGPAVVVARARQHRGSGDLVRAPAVEGVAGSVVDADLDARVAGRVRSGEADRVGAARVAAAARDLDSVLLSVTAFPSLCRKLARPTAHTPCRTARAPAVRRCGGR